MNTTQDRYGVGAIGFHWLSVALIVLLGILGLLLEDIPRASQAYWINIHGTIGLVYLTLVVLRIGWRVTHSPPALPPHAGEFSRRLSYPVHMALYALMIAIPIAGIVAYVWHGRAFDYGLFKIDLAVKSDRAVFHTAEGVHSAMAYALFAIAGLHAAAALWHHFVNKDDVLARMLPGANRGPQAQ